MGSSISKEDKEKDKQKKLKRTSKELREYQRLHQQQQPKSESVKIESPEEWQTLSQLTPSMIPDNQITYQYYIPSFKFTTEDDVLKDRGFELYNKIGEGSFGVVRKGKRNSDDAPIACKTIEITNQNRIRDLKNELFALVKLRHPNIVNLYDHFMVNSTCYIIMEFASGGSLSDYVKKKGPLKENLANKWFREIVSGLYFMHRRKLSHQDLKLGNNIIENQSLCFSSINHFNNLSFHQGNVLIAIDENSTLKPPDNMSMKITDFGLSRVSFKETQGIVKKTSPAGTVLFMAPEIIRLRLGEKSEQRLTTKMNVHVKKKPYDPFSADIWALGVMLYVMVTKNYPFQPKDRPKMYVSQINRDYPSPTKVSPELKSFIGSMLDPNPINRITIIGVITHPWIDPDGTLINFDQETE